MLTDDQLREFGRVGYLVVEQVVAEAFLAAADAEIDDLVAQEPAEEGTAGHHFYWRAPDGLPAAHAALRDSGALAVAGELTAPEPLDLILDHIQVALNIPPYHHRPGGPHIDGHRPDQDAPASFTLLAGIFLGDETGPDRGNLWIWPGSHLVHERLFREQGSRALLEHSGHVSFVRDPPALPQPHPVYGRRGDLLLSHFLTGHNIGGNLCPRTRRMLYYRLGCPGHGERWEATFTDALTEYAPVRRALAVS
jgi:hypothetical protein